MKFMQLLKHHQGRLGGGTPRQCSLLQSPVPALRSRHYSSESRPYAARSGNVSSGPTLVPHYPVIWGTKMKALVKAESGPGVVMTTVPKPAIGPNDVLIKVSKSAICGTDVHIYKWDSWAQRTIPVPMTIGHEYCGVVVETGSEVRGLKEGDRVSGEGHITCGYCRNCKAGRQHLCRNTVGVGVNRPGAFAEYLALPAQNIFRLHDKVTDDHASFMDALGNAVHTALSFDLIGEDVLITGAGPIGCMAAAVCNHVGARHVLITDVNNYRLQVALKCGATRALNVGGMNHEEAVAAVTKVMDELGMREGWDIGLEMSGIESAFQTMLATMNNGGRIAVLGIPSNPLQINLDNVVFKGLTLKGIYGREMFETWYKMSNMLIGGLDKKIEPVITHRYDIDDFQKGFDAMLSGDSGKVILDWTKLH